MGRGGSEKRMQQKQMLLCIGGCEANNSRESVRRMEWDGDSESESPTETRVSAPPWNSISFVFMHSSGNVQVFRKSLGGSHTFWILGGTVSVNQSEKFKRCLTGFIPQLTTRATRTWHTIMIMYFSRRPMDSWKILESQISIEETYLHGDDVFEQLYDAGVLLHKRLQAQLTFHHERVNLVGFLQTEHCENGRLIENSKPGPSERTTDKEEHEKHRRCRKEE